MAVATKVTLIIYNNDWESETFVNFTGVIPKVGELVKFYKKEHDGCFYGGIVKKVEHRIEYATQNDGKKKTLQGVHVFCNEEYKEETMSD